MSRLLQHWAQAPADSTAPAWLQAQTQQARAQLAQAIWPTRQTEAWKYTRLQAIEQGDFQRIASSAPLSQAPKLWEGLPVYPVVLVNGHLCAQHSCTHALDALQITRFCDATAEQQAIITEALNRYRSPAPPLFSLLNAQGLQQGLLLQIKAQAQLDRPILLLHLAQAGAQPAMACPRVLIQAGAQSRCEIIEHWHEDTNSPGMAAVFTNALTQITLAPQAQLMHYCLQDETDTAVHIGRLQVGLQANSRFNHFYTALGSRLKRLDLQVNHLEPGAQADLQGLYLPIAQQHIDVHLSIEHRCRGGNSQAQYRGIIADQAQAVFNGRIHILPQAQQTVAQLYNKNLLRSNQAVINTKPELEIYADDVRCAHGATVSQLNAQQQHYLRSRGLSAAQADQLLGLGFINELIQSVHNPRVRQMIHTLAASVFEHSGPPHRAALQEPAN